MVRKILFIIFAAFFFFSFLPKTYADSNCPKVDVTSATPNQIVTTDTAPANIHLLIHGDQNLPTGTAIYIWMEGPGATQAYTDWLKNGNTPMQFTVNSDHNIPLDGIGYNDGRGGQIRFPFSSDYTLHIFTNSSGTSDYSKQYCSVTFHVDFSPKYSQFCTPNVFVKKDDGTTITDGTQFTPDTTPFFTATNISIPGNFTAVLYKLSSATKADFSDPIGGEPTSTSNLASGVPFISGGTGKYPPGTYLAGVSIPTVYGLIPICYQIFAIQAITPPGTPPSKTCIQTTGCKTTAGQDAAGNYTDTQGNCCTGGTCIGDRVDGVITGGVCVSSLSSIVGGGGGIYEYPIDQAVPSPVCSQISGTEYQCHTAIGDINTSPGELVKSLMGVILSLAGGIALLLIIISGYRMMVSQGNPEQIKNAREQLTAAVIGLLFVIFSLVILQVIGVNILGLPGFK